MIHPNLFTLTPVLQNTSSCFHASKTPSLIAAGHYHSLPPSLDQQLICSFVFITNPIPNTAHLYCWNKQTSHGCFSIVTHVQLMWNHFSIRTRYDLHHTIHDNTTNTSLYSTQSTFQRSLSLSFHLCTQQHACVHSFKAAQRLTASLPFLCTPVSFAFFAVFAPVHNFSANSLDFHFYPKTRLSISNVPPSGTPPTFKAPIPLTPQCH